MNSNNLETESVVEDNSVNEMEKSFTQEAIEDTSRTKLKTKYRRRYF